MIPKAEVLQKYFSTPLDNPLVPRFPIEFRDTEILTILYRTDQAAIEEIVPEPLEVVSDYVLVHFYHMNDAEWFGRYHEFAAQVEVQLKGGGEHGVFSPYLYLGNDGAIATGREIYGQPKKYGDIELEVYDDLIVGRVRRNSIDVITGTLPYKIHRAEPQELTGRVPFTTNINLKLVPNIDGEPAIAQLTARTFENVRVKECWKGPATVEIRPNANAPLYRLPVRQVIEGFYWVVDFVLPFGRVIYDYLREEG